MSFDDDTHVLESCRLITWNENAIRVEYRDETYWIPRSLIVNEVDFDHEIVDLELPVWWLHRKDLL